MAISGVEDIKNSEWFQQFLLENGMSEEQFLNNKDVQGLISKYESFLLKIDMDPLVASPQDYEKVNNLELAERYDEVLKLEHKPEGCYINKELDETAYYAAVRSLTCSGDEINTENLQKHIKENSNRIATSYYAGIWAASQDQEKLQKHAGDKFLDVCHNINDMVQSGKNKEEIYAKLFKNQKPSADIEKLVTSTVYTQETTTIKDWCSKIGRATGGLLDKIQKFEQDNPHVVLASSLAISSVPGAGRVYSALRMGLTVAQIYKEAKREGKTFGQVLKDPVKKKQLGMLCARLIPGGRVVIMADAMKNMFSQQYKQNIANNAGKAGQAIKNLWKSKGRDKQAWKDLWHHGGKTVAIVAGTAMTATGVYALADNVDIADTSDISNTNPENLNSQDTTLETKTQEQGEHWTETSGKMWEKASFQAGEEPAAPVAETENTLKTEAPSQEQGEHWTETSRKMWENSTLHQEEQKGNYVEMPAEEINRQEDVNTNQSSSQETGDKVSDIDVNNLSDSQKHDIEMLFKRDPATANAMINDGKWHSSAELQKMWDGGQVSDELKSDMLKFSGERFDDAGHFVDKDGKIDINMEEDAIKWQARQDAGRNDVNGDSVSNNNSQSQDQAGNGDSVSNNSNSLPQDQVGNGDSVSNNNSLPQDQAGNGDSVSNNNSQSQDLAGNGDSTLNDGEMHQVGSIKYSIEMKDGVYKCNYKGSCTVDQGILRQMRSIELQQSNNGFCLDNIKEREVLVEATKMTVEEEIYKDMENRMANGEELSDAEKRFMKQHEEKRESFTTKETYRNGNVKSQTDYKGNTTTYRRDGSLETYTPRGGETQHYNRDGEIQNQEEIATKRPNINALRGISGEEHKPKVNVETSLEKPRPLMGLSKAGGR